MFEWVWKKNKIKYIRYYMFKGGMIILNSGSKQVENPTKFSWHISLMRQVSLFKDARFLFEFLFGEYIR